MTRMVRWVGVGILLSGGTGMLPAQRGTNKNTVAPPTGITFTPSASTLTIAWAAATGASKYSVLRRQGTAQEQLGQVTTTSFSFALPTAGVTYEYQVISIGRVSQEPSAWIPYTVAATAVILPPPPPGTGTIITEPRPTGTPTIVPAGPATLSATSTIPGQIALAFPTVANASGYRITRSSATAAETDLVHLGLQGGTTVSYVNAPVEIGPTFTYKVYAFFGTGTSTVVSTPSPAASAASIPIGQPTQLRLYQVASGSRAGVVNATYTWNAGTLAGVEKFIVWLGTGTVLGYPTSINFVHPDVAAGQTYTVCVAAIYPYGIRDDKTGACAPMTITAGPSQLTAASTLPGQISLSWSPVPGAQAYRILRSNSGGEVDRNIGEVAATSKVDGGVDFRWTYTYKVFAMMYTPGGMLQSGSSPWTSATSLPFVQVSGLSYSVAVSTNPIGTLDVTLRWSPVAGAEYDVFAASGATIGHATGPEFVYRGVPPRYTYNVCVTAAYPYNIRDVKTAPCIEIKL